MFGLYDTDWDFVAGPFDTSEDAFIYAVENGIFPHKIAEM